MKDGATGVDPESVQVSVNAVPAVATYRPIDERGGLLQVAVDGTLPDGPNLVSATFTDNSATDERPANEGSAEWGFTVDTTPDGIEVTNVSPFLAEGNVEPGAEVVVIADAVVAGTMIASDDGIWQFSLDLATSGLVALRLHARDSVGNVSEP